MLLFVDQLEELDTLVKDEELRRRFVQAISLAADDPETPVRAVFTLREEFIGRLAEAGAHETLSRITVMRRPNDEALEEILVRPLAVRGYSFDDRNAGEIVAEVTGEGACLPLLQFAGEQLWERRDKERRLLLRSSYEAIGGVAGALAQHADGVLSGLSAAEVRLARAICLRLVTAEGTRKVVARSRALEGLGEGSTEVLERLAARRLVLVKQSEQEGEAELSWRTSRWC